jgi:hypothetical protein
VILRALAGLVGLRLAPVDYEELDVGTTALGFTAAKLTGVHAVHACFAGSPMRFRVDGVADPTDLVGLESPGVAAERVFNAPEARQFRAIRSTGTNGKVYATFYKLVP